MRIGVFDSGLGGLSATHAIAKALPQYDYIYLGDTARVPYGDRSQETVYRYTEEAVRFLLEEADCALVIIACNTASAEALRRIQQEFLPAHFPDRKVLGVLVPMAEAAAEASQPLGLMATRSTIASGAYQREIGKFLPDVTLTEIAAPLLVPLIENDALHLAPNVLETYTQPLLDAGVSTVILGCTHYGLAKSRLAEHLPGITLITQEDVIPGKLAGYLQRHPEITTLLSQNSRAEYLLTEVTPHYTTMAAALGLGDISFTPVIISAS